MYEYEIYIYAESPKGGQIMNLLYLRYALAVASNGSINKAAEKLYMDQPNLSRCIKDLEASLGVSIFTRSTRGMKPTPEGEEFLKYAEKILNQVDAVENMFRKDYSEKRRFSISVPLASYVSEAFTSFASKLPKDGSYELIYKETNSVHAIRNILESDYKLGIIRYASQYDKHYKEWLDNKGITYELLNEFHYVLLVNENSPLAEMPEIHYSDLSDKIEIVHANPYVPSLSLADVKKEDLPEVDKQIFIFERSIQFEMLAKDPQTFMWVSQCPPDVLQRYGLVQRKCNENRKTYKDVIIHKADYMLSDLDKEFITELCRVKREIF